MAPSRERVKATAEFFAAAASSNTEECIMWPFGPKGSKYYPTYGKMTAHRRMSIAVYGPPPPDMNYSLHSCGNGRLGCVNPRHLRWGTNLDNTIDRQNSDKNYRGSNHHNAKLNEDDVVSIRYLLNAGVSARVLAKNFEVAPGTVYSVNYGRWNHIDRSGTVIQPV